MEAPAGAERDELLPRSVYDRCVRCGLCLPTCPTYVETLVETSSPRGRIALLKAVSEGTLERTSPGFVHQVSECLDCRACEAVCPSGVEYGRLIEPARAFVRVATAPSTSAGQKLRHEVLIGWLFGNLWLMRLVAWFVRLYQRSGLQRLARSSGLLRLLRLDAAERLAPRISDRFFVPRDQIWRAATLERTATVFLHAGCVMQVAFADVDEATVRVLQRCGCDVLVPRGQGCCGAIALHAGDPARTRALAQRNIRAFEESGADVYVVNAAGCGAALKEYGELFEPGDEWHDRACAFAANVRDLTEYLDEIGLAPGLGAINAIAVYQDPCHLIHAQRIAAAPRRLLAQIPGLRVRELHDGALCCGAAGTYNLTEPEMSQRLGRRKADAIVAAEPNVVATANPGCALQLSIALRDAGRPIPVKHVVELIDASYAAYSPTSGASPAKAASMSG